MQRTTWSILLVSSLWIIIAARHAQAQQLPEPGEPLPAFLRPPPRELLQRGLEPLSTQLPDSSVRGGLLPPDASQGLFNERSQSYDRGEQWTERSFHWLPAELCHRPLYFEDAMLERHGQSRHGLVQPLASGTRFFASIAALPYKAVVDPPRRPRSTLGHFRAGSGAPCLLQRPPWQANAGLAEAGLIVGLIFIVP